MGKSINDLLSELHPLIKYLAGTSDYKKLRFSVSDMESFFTEKLLYVWMKWSERLPYEEVKAITIASLYNYRGKIYKKYAKEIPLADHPVPSTDGEPYRDLVEEAAQYLTQDQAVVLEILVDPPFYIRDKVVAGKRIPSHVVLEYLDMPQDKQTVKDMNTFRRQIFTSLEAQLT